MTRDDPAAFAPPPAFGPFRVLHQIGIGALGPVFRTYEPTRDRLVAVKVFRLDVTPETAQSLADELARAADAGLFHPSIVEPVAAGVEGSVAYRAEEYVAAESLDVAMRHYAPATLDRALPFLTQLAGAIDFARTAGVGHGALHLRDVFVTPDEARASGFGIVEALERVGVRAPVRRPYTAPERIAGAAWSTPADVFSLAAIAYELLTGRRPSGTGDQIGDLSGENLGDRASSIQSVLARAMEHIEEAGIHSGDSSCVIPPHKVIDRHVALIRDYTRRIARALKVVGLMNTQFAIKEDVIYVLEVNPRASRTVPYLSKATGVPLAKVAARVMIGRTLEQLGLTEDLEVSGFFVKTPVFPFVRFPGVDTILGPEMKSTGEVMGGAPTFGTAFAKAQIGAGMQLPLEGTAFISVNNHDKPAVVQIARDLRDLGFRLVATRGTASYLRAHGLNAEIVFKVNEGRPHVGDEILNDKIQLVINTPLGRESFFDDRTVRRIAMMHGVPSITTLTGAAATVNAIKALRSEGLSVRALQEYHAETATQ